MNILITGKTGYISNALHDGLALMPNTVVRQESVRNATVNDISLTGIDTIIHAAAIVHKKESTQSEEIYKEVNTELTIALATKAKENGVKHFVFISTMAVYGSQEGELNKGTALTPQTLYGKSKLLAEQALQQLEDSTFTVTIVRPPMVYGPDCPGNYALLSKLAQKTFIFPKVSNKRSMIFIGNLVEFLKQVVLSKDSGIYHPQDEELVNTTKMVKQIATVHGKKLMQNKLSGNVLKLVIGNKGIYKKVFGDLYYHQQLSTYRDNSYQKYNFEQAIAITEKKM